MTSATFLTRSALPSGWKRMRLLDLVSIRTGQVDPRRPEYRNLPLIAPDHVDSRTGRLLRIESARAQGAISGKYLVAPGDVVYSKIRPYLEKAMRCNFRALCSADMYPLTPKSGVDGSFVLHTLLGADFTNFAVSVSARSGIPKINRAELAQYVLPVPPLSEQRAISAALDDVDDLIGTLERLIAKKQAIKQGMMQQLLTGRTRLPGHGGDWVMQPLRSVLGKLEAGVSVNSVSEPGYYAVLKTSCVSGGGFDPSESKTIAPSDIARVKVSPRADTLIISRMNTPFLVGEVGYVADDWPNLFLPDRLWLVTKSHADSVDMCWLSYALCFSENAARLKELATGTSGSMKNIAKGPFLNFTLLYPPLDEQVAIARVLSDLDRDLVNMRRRLTKMQGIKQGMIQELLTGRTRVPVAEAVA
jgi:type I restriction enzyme, S subunit